MSDFKVGQRVWSMARGWGKVVRVDSGEFPIIVNFNCDKITDEYYFTNDGRYTSKENRTLFFKEIPIPADALISPVDEIILNPGDIVLFKAGGFGYIEKYSGPEEKTFAYHTEVPQSLDEAFDYGTAMKKHIKMIVGNINA